jgi:hypothetical protein
VVLVLIIICQWNLWMNWTLNKLESCMNWTLNKLESCINWTLNKPESCIKRILNKLESCINWTSSSYRFWLPPFGIFKLFFMYHTCLIFYIWKLLWLHLFSCLNKLESCINWTLNKPESCINLTLHCKKSLLR